MPHPFEVGKTYRNRIGEYVVVTIDGDRMKLRYQNGKTLDTSARIQARIWENIQFEEAMARNEERIRLAREARQEARKRGGKKRARPEFKGFQKSDFEPKSRGIAWSSRKQLGAVLALRLGELTKSMFSYWIVPRQSAVHIGRKDRYNLDERDNNAALFVSVNEDGVTFGFYVGKPDGRVLVKWPWLALVNALKKEANLETLRSAIETSGSSLDVYAMRDTYGLVGKLKVDDSGFIWHEENETQEVTQPLEGEKVAGHLRTVGKNKKCEMFMRKRLPPSAALIAGSSVPDELVAVLETLVPLYDASVGA
jgi:hypothetical protein